MNIHSCSRAMRGVRLMAASILPASFRAGIIIERLGLSGFGDGEIRAITKRVNVKHGTRGASQRFSSSGMKPGKGNRILPQSRILTQPLSVKKFSTSFLDSQLSGGEGGMNLILRAPNKMGVQRALKILINRRVLGSAAG